jgi:hypothetical protein
MIAAGLNQTHNSQAEEIRERIRGATEQVFLQKRKKNAKDIKYFVLIVLSSKVVSSKSVRVVKSFF